ncbi:hypothetical protein YC2023_084287 [Brassica napus]
MFYFLSLSVSLSQLFFLDVHHDSSLFGRSLFEIQTERGDFVFIKTIHSILRAKSIYSK